MNLPVALYLKIYLCSLNLKVQLPSPIVTNCCAVPPPYSLKLNCGVGTVMVGNIRRK